jgi:hypothetical protein
MGPRKAGRKHDFFTKESNPNVDILSDTIARTTNTIKSWKQVYDILEQEISLCSNDSTEEWG